MSPALLMPITEPSSFYVTLGSLGSMRQMVHTWIKDQPYYKENFSASISDPDLMQIVGEVLQNVIRHAYGEDGGDIEIGMDQSVRGHVLWFKDHGKGMAADRLEMVRSNLYRYMLPDDFEFQESGMGLPLLSFLLQSFRVSVESEEGYGTTLSIFKS